MDKLGKIFGLNPLRNQRVHVLHLRGTIDPAMTYKVYKALKKFKGQHSSALALVINSTGGSPAQAYLIMKRLESIRQKYNIPIYTFAEDHAISAAFLLHQQGDKRYCDDVSLLGKVGTQIVQTKVVKLLERLQVDVRENTTSQLNFNRLTDPFIDSGSETLQGINDHINERFVGLFKQLYSQRTLNIPEMALEDLYQGEVFLGKPSIEYGLAQGNQNYMQVLAQDFPGIKLEDLTRKTKREKFIDFFQGLQSKMLFDSLSGVVGMALKK